MARKASTNPKRWASETEALSLVAHGWIIISYGTGHGAQSVLLALGV